MALGVKESVSGKLYQLTADGTEERVCGGKGAVYLSGPKVALRCCGKTSIVATRQTKQSVLRQGDVLLLGLRDAFYANGTLTKYEVVDTDAAPPKVALHVLPTRVPSITMSSAASSRPKAITKRAPAATGARLVSSFFAKRNASPSPKIQEKKQVKNEDVDDVTASSTAEDVEEEDEELAPSTRRRGKRTRVIVESEDEADTNSSKMQDLKVDSDVSSPGEDDIFEKDLEKSTSAAKDWMAAFGRNGVKKHKSESSNVDGWRSKKEVKPKKRAESTTSRRFTYEDRNNYDDSDEDEHYSRSHDEVGQLLEECEGIARKLRQSVRNWSGNAAKSASSSPSTSPGDATDEEEAVHMSLASINGGDRRVVTQNDIPDICETLELKPYQNKLNELLTMLSFLMPRMFDHGSDELLSFFDGSEQKKCEKVRKILAPFILRREKKYVLSQLVPKTISFELVKVGEEQRKAYTELLESVVKRREAQAARKAAAKELKKNKGKDHKAERRLRELMGTYATPSGGEPTAMSIFTQLRKAANHPVLLRRHFVSDEVLETLSRCLHRAEAFGNQCSISRVRQELESYSDFELHDLCVQYEAIDELRQLQLPMETLLASAKFDYLRTLLPKLQKEGHRVLIFSQWTKLLDLLEVLMSHMEYRYLRLDGSTDVQERQGLIDTYNEDKNIFVFLLSTRAGGLGINLTAADTVVLHDLDFNPTADEQACDRCHRIGQTKPVSIYKLVSENTVDQDIYKLGESKTELNHKILDKLNAHGDGKKKAKKSDAVTVEMLLASVISDYKSAQVEVEQE
ncbi:hypothetical protein PC116_g7493 [Phytophthora cactorum]|nr:hypothetical protein PC116_g7493 [Phytophthora cactorum]